MKKNKEDLVNFVENLKLQWVSLIDSIVDPIMIVDQDYIISKANKSFAKIANQDVKSVIGKKCYEVFTKAKSPCEGCQMLEAANTGKPCSFESEKIIQGKFFEISSQPITNQSGELDGVVQVYRDRTEAKSLHLQLIQSEKLASIGLLAGGIAHEINNPLGGILIFSQMLLKEVDQESPHYQDIIEIEAATQRCKEIVDRLLDFARQQPGDVAKLTKKIRLAEIIKTAMRFAKVSKNGKKCEVFYEWDDENAATYGDSNRLIQVFLNLFQNAFQAMPDGGNLTIVHKSRKEKEGDFHRIEIKDTGLGISKENVESIFDPFFTTKEPGEGTGLGLAICYGIIKEMGGQLWVESEVNEGTSFFVQIPSAKEA